MKKKLFLANVENKQKFIHLLALEMQKYKDIDVKYAVGDADYDIVSSACNIAQQNAVIVVGDDTDLFVLLQHHYSPASHQPMYLQTSNKLIDISVLQTGINNVLSNTLLFIHAMSGCDTTSKPYGIGKVSALGKFNKLEESAKVFFIERSTKGEYAQGRK